MAKSRIANVRLRGITTCVPDTLVTMADDAVTFGEDEMRRVVKNTGVKSRRVAKNLCTTDMTQDAAELLLRDLGWAKDSIDVIVLVTQTPDYPAPASACLVQHRMGLPTTCAAFDVNLGCSGYVYGLWMLASFLSTGSMKRGLLLVGDTATRGLSPEDRSVVPLFGDAGSATALEFDPSASPMSFVLRTDGSGGPHLCSRAGGTRKTFTRDSFDMALHEDGVMRSDAHTVMNGAEVLTFALREVPPLLNEMLTYAEWNAADVDRYVFHQASTFMLKNLGRCARLPPDKVTIGLDGYGNASSASIPLAISDQLYGTLSAKSEKLLLAGFGVGWSWAAATIECGPIVIPQIVVTPDVKREVAF